MDIRLARRASTFQQLDGVMTGHQLLCSDPVTFHVTQTHKHTNKNKNKLLARAKKSCDASTSKIMFLDISKAHLYAPMLDEEFVEPKDGKTGSAPD